MASEATHFVLSSGPYRVDYTTGGWSGPTLVLTTPDGSRTFSGAQVSVQATPLGTEVEVLRDAYPTWKRLFTLILPAPVMVDASAVAVAALGVFTDVQTSIATGEVQKYEVVQLQGTGDRGREANHLALQGGSYKLDFTASGSAGLKLVVTNPDGTRTFSGAQITTAPTPIGTEISVQFDQYATWKRTLTLLAPTVLVPAAGSAPVSTLVVMRDIPTGGPGPSQGPGYSPWTVTGTANQV
jgi:hypothetical protein